MAYYSIPQRLKQMWWLKVHHFNEFIWKHWKIRCLNMREALYVHTWVPFIINTCIDSLKSRVLAFKIFSKFLEVKKGGLSWPADFTFLIYYQALNYNKRNRMYAIISTDCHWISWCISTICLHLSESLKSLISTLVLLTVPTH